MEELGEWEEMERYVGGCFGRGDSREVASAYLRGLLSPTERKNGWQLAETLGHSTPYKVQQFLYRGWWSAEALRNELQAYVKAHLGSEDGVLVVDETGFLKKGRSRRGSSGNIVARRGGLKTRKSGSF